jgi:hypothetical protein
MQPIEKIWRDKWGEAGSAQGDEQLALGDCGFEKVAAPTKDQTGTQPWAESTPLLVSIDFFFQCGAPRGALLGSSCKQGARDARQPQPSSLIAHPAFQILVMWRILSPAKSMT